MEEKNHKYFPELDLQYTYSKEAKEKKLKQHYSLFFAIDEGNEITFAPFKGILGIFCKFSMSLLNLS